MADLTPARVRENLDRVRERIAAAAREAKGMFMPAMCMRFWPQWAWLKQAIVEKRYVLVGFAAFLLLVPLAITST